MSQLEMKWIILVLTMITVCAAASNSPRLVCYLDGRAQYRLHHGTFKWARVNASLCTHLIYVMQSNDEQLDYNAFRDLKDVNPRLKVMISTANWIPKGRDQLLGRGTINQFSNVIHDMLKISSVVDGIDISWPPEGETYVPKDYHKAYFVNQLRDLRKAFGRRYYIISLSASGNVSVADSAYNIAKIDELVDFVNLRTYNLSNSTTGKIDFHAPLYRRKWETDEIHTPNVDSIVNYWIDKGISKSKLNVGIPFFGKSWILASSSIYPPSNAKTTGDPGTYTAKRGLLAFYEICQDVRSRELNPIRVINGNNMREGLFAYKERKIGSQWVAYDDPLMVKDKATYIVEKQLGGAAVWDISLDDFRGACNLGTNPLLTAACETLKITTCVASSNTNQSTSTISLFSTTSGSTKNIPKHYWLLVFLPFCLAFLLRDFFL